MSGGERERKIHRMPKRAVPAWLDVSEDWSETLRYRAMTPEERLRVLVQVQEVARRLLENRPDREQILNRREPMSAEAERVWLKLVREARLERDAR